MSLHLLKNKFHASTFGLTVLVLFTLLFYLILHTENYSVEQRIKFAEDYVKNWQLEKAENILIPAVEGENYNGKFINLYLDVLIKEGKINKAKTFFLNLKKNRISDNPNLLSQAAQIYFFNGVPDSADIFARKAVAAAKKRNNKQVESKANNIIGLAKFYLAQYDSAVVYQERALRLAKNFNLKKEEADALRQIGVISWYNGKLDSALNYFYLPALKLYRESNDKIGEAITLNDIGLLYFDKKNWYKEYPYHLQAYKIQKQINDLIGLADTYYFLADVPNFNRTIQNYKYNFLTKSYNLSSKIGYKWGKLIAAKSIIKFVFNNSSTGASLPINVNALVDNTGEGQLISKVLTFYESQKTKNYDKIISTGKKILQISDSLGYAVYKYWAYYYLSSVLTKMGKLNDAEEYILKSKALTYTKNGRKYHSINTDLILAEIYKKQKKIYKAINLLSKKAAEYDSIYSKNINKPQTIYNYESAVVAVYMQRSTIYSLLLDDLYDVNKPGEFFKYSERQRLLPFWGKYNDSDLKGGISFSDLLIKFQNEDIVNTNNTSIFRAIDKLEKVIEIKNKEVNKVNKMPGYNSYITTITLTEIQKKLNDEDVFVEYTFGEKNIYAFVIRKDKKKLLLLNSTRKDIARLINFFREALQRGKDKPEDRLWIGPAKNLYNLLVKPIVNSGLLKKGNNLIISPHNSLYFLPFDALITGDENSFLLFDYNISYVSSSQSINKNRKLKLNSYLGVAPATKDLNFSQAEIINIPKSLFKVKKQLLNNSATKNNFLKLAPRFDVIHIASHTNINIASPLYSSIQFTDQSLKIYEIFKANIKPVLLILSACETGKALGMVNDIPTGIDLVNFSRAFREAGVKSVIATKWLVEDLSAYRIINNFFKIMELNKNSLPVENILTLAQREYLVNAKKLGNKTHPFFWAPFFLMK